MRKRKNDEGEKKDGRKQNKGAIYRRRFTARDKIKLVDDVEEGFECGVAKTPIEFFRLTLLPEQEAQYRANQYYKWSKPDVYGGLLDEVVHSKRKAVRIKSPFHEVEVDLYEKMRTMRKRGLKVSSKWIQINALKIFGELKTRDAAKWRDVNFKASRGWASRFMKRKKIKFRKRKCGKEISAQECVPAIELFLTNIRFNFLLPRENDGADGRDPLWGRFLPERRYNMDQVPLPFVVGQDHTFTTYDDDDVHIKCPKEALRKRQFTMHVVVNAGTGEKGACWVDLVCKGLGKRIRRAEKDLWNGNVGMFWQKNAWVDTEVMIQLAEKFVRHKNEMHGEDVWVILYCDNLRAHLATEVKRIFGEGKVFLCFLPPNMTHFLQPIDAGIGRSLRNNIANYLDEWLMNEENLTKWEGVMTAGERRILTTNLVGKSQEQVLLPENNAMRVACFERTGCLITFMTSEQFDSKIKPQGVEPGTLKVPTDDSLIRQDQNNDVETNDDGVDEEQAAQIEEQNNIAEAVGNDDESVLMDNE